MLDITLDVYQSTALGAIVMVLGLFLVNRSETLRKFCIPAAVAGGLVFAILNTVLHYGDIAEFHFDETLKNVMMTVFFCSVGFMASFRMLKVGGRLVVLLLALISILLVAQDVIGSVLASLLGWDPKLGLALGSISLVGGHGTAASYGQLLIDKFGLIGADTVAIAAATFGLAVSGFIGGPLSRKLVESKGLRPDAEDIEFSKEEEVTVPVDDHRFLTALILIVLCMGAGTYIVSFLSDIGLTVPTYIGAMLLALVIRNVADHKGYDLPIKEMSTLGNICLAMFLAMALMTMKLWQIADLALGMAAILIIQAVVVALFAYFIIFRFTGKNYDSAALVTATCGFGLGATP
ncbi:MAG: sodium/glutamate symporter, partial [archaeon]|nr:sodium/glutamate symporter [archaeon]